MEKTADLAIVQKTIIDTLHKEGKSQRVITERGRGKGEGEGEGGGGGGGGCSFSSRTLAPAHSAKTTSKWFADHDITVLDWPANMPDLNPIWNLWDFSRER